MTDNEIKALAEKYANTVDWKLGSEFYTSHQMWGKAKEAFEAGYRANHVEQGVISLYEECWFKHNGKPIFNAKLFGERVAEFIEIEVDQTK